MSSYFSSFVLLYLSGEERVIFVVHGFVKSIYSFGNLLEYWLRQ